jgi:nucleoside-diphosphate-sugar epimerase
MKALFIGGTGVISSACSRLAVERGADLTLLNRGRTERPIPSGIHLLQADVRDRESYSSALDGRIFDVVVNWIVYTPEQLEVDLRLFQGRTAQYIFISSASAYQTPPASLPVTESTPLDNPYWEYSRLKAACEQRLLQAYRHDKFPLTIVRPSHTYDQTLSPLQGGYTMIARMRSNRPVVVHGDGTSLWTLTHHEDFARGFVGLMGNPRTIGESFHITSDEILTWNQIYQIMGNAAGAEPQLVHVSSELIAAYDPIWGAGLLGDKTQSMIFDNTKIRRLVPDFVASIPFSQGAKQIIDWYDADPTRQQVDQTFDHLLDRIIAAYRKAWPRA